MQRKALLVGLLSLWVSAVESLLAVRRPWLGSRSQRMSISAETDEASESEAREEEAWRTFRARLVAAERNASAAADWVYESSLLEQGTVILGGTEQAVGFGLFQQYFHKCVILLLEHNERFTKGIIVNRASNMRLRDSSGSEWPVWFGGDVLSLSAEPQTREYVCLHRLESDMAKRVSIEVLPGIYWTTFDVASELVRQGAAKTDDFWLFLGFAGWAPDQLQGELDQNAWYTLAADSSVVMAELLKQSQQPEPEEAGFKTWETLMHRLGKEDEVETSKVAPFEDDMLREWTHAHLVPEREVEVPEGTTSGDFAAFQEGTANSDENDVKAEKRRKRASKSKIRIERGSVLRSRSPPPPSVILERQFLHRSVVLVLEKSERFTLGVVLNRPGVGRLRVPSRPIMFGGDVRAVGGMDDMPGGTGILLLHRRPELKKTSRKIGDSGVWLITPSSVEAAIHGGLARLEDFLAVAGFVFWNFDELEQEIEEQGSYDIVQRPDEFVPWQDIWNLADPETANMGIDVWKDLGSAAGFNDGPGSDGMDEVKTKQREQLADRALTEFAKMFLDS